MDSGVANGNGVGSVIVDVLSMFFPQVQEIGSTCMREHMELPQLHASTGLPQSYILLDRDTTECQSLSTLTSSYSLLISLLISLLYSLMYSIIALIILTRYVCTQDIASCRE